MKQVMGTTTKSLARIFSLADLRGFNDVNNRLARKQGKCLYRNEQLDLVIVVDISWPVFDAPCLSTLFIDRKPMRPQDLIRPLAGPIRIFDDKKH